MLRHQPEDDHAVGHRQRVGVGEVELVLPVAAFVVEGVDTPAELVHVVDHRLEEGVRLHGGVEVVSAGGQVDGVVGHEGDPVAVHLPQDVELGLDSHVHDVALLGREPDLPLEHRPGVVVVGPAVELQVRRGDRVAPVPREHDERFEIRLPHALVLVRAEPPHAFERSHRVELRTGQVALEVVDGHRLRLRHPVEIDIGAEESGDAGGLECFLGTGRMRHGRMGAPWQGARRAHKHTLARPAIKLTAPARACAGVGEFD